MKKLPLASAAALVVLLVSAAAAAAKPHVVVWAGGLAPGTPATGVELLPNGSGRVVVKDAHGTLHARGTLAAHGKTLVAIQEAAERVLDGGPAVTHVKVEDGGYTSVLVQDGGRERAVTDTGVDSPRVASLLEHLDRALSPGAQIAPMRKPQLPSTAPCAPGQHPTDIAKKIDVPQAVASGLIKGLTPKGSLGGDAVAVDALWKPLPLTTFVTVHLEVSGPPGTDWSEKLQANLATRYGSDRAVDGKPVVYDFDVVNRAPGAAPRACYHEINLHAKDDVRSYVTGHDGSQPQAGEWTAPDVAAWAHEVGHLLGLEDAYDDYFVVKATGEEIKLPQRGLEGAALQAALPPHIKLTDGEVISKPWFGHEHDLMGDTGRGSKLEQVNLDEMVRYADIEIYDSTGLLLVNKNNRDQSMATGGPFALRVPYLQAAHIDGMVAYCIDFHKKAPGFDGQEGFDVVGRAGDINTPTMQALQRVLDVIAARSPGPLEETPGANEAIWRITDNLPIDPDDTYARAIVQAAGVPPDVTPETTYAAPHLDDPNAATPGPVALSAPDGALVPALSALPMPAAPQAKLVGLVVGPQRLRAPRGHRAAALFARVTLDGLADSVKLTLTHGSGKRTKTLVRTRAKTLAVGQTLLNVSVRGLKPGAYRLMASSAHGGTRQVTLKVRRAR